MMMLLVQMIDHDDEFEEVEKVAMKDVMYLLCEISPHPNHFVLLTCHDLTLQMKNDEKNDEYYLRLNFSVAEDFD